MGRRGGLATPGSSPFPLLRGQVALRNSFLSLGIGFLDCNIKRSEGAQISFQQCLKAAIESKSPLGAQKEHWSISVLGMKKTQSLFTEKGITAGCQHARCFTSMHRSCFIHELLRNPVRYHPLVLQMRKPWLRGTSNTPAISQLVWGGLWN